jgi:chromosome segregation ATPase
MRLLLLAFVALAAGSQAPPAVQRVIQLLIDLKAKALEEKRTEQTNYERYAQWCSNVQAEKKNSIKVLTDEIAQSTAQIDTAKSNIECLTKHIEQHDNRIQIATGDLSAGKAVREIERQAFEVKLKDYTESVDALSNAIKVLKSQNFDRKQAEDKPVTGLLQSSVLAELRRKRAPKGLMEAVTALLQGAGDDDKDLDKEYKDMISREAPQAHGYEFQSQKIIDMLQKLYDEFDQKRTDLMKNEAQRKQAFDMDQNLMSNEVEHRTSTREDNTEERAENMKNKASAEQELSEDTAAKEADEQFLEETTKTCDQTAKDYAAVQKLRAEEMQMFDKVINLMKSSQVGGSAPSLLQTRAMDSPSARRMEAARVLQTRADELDSKSMSTIAVQLASGAGPFDKIMGMIRDLIKRLQEEAGSEAEHKGWCDTELGKNKNNREKHSTAVEKLTAQIAELEGNIADLGEQIVEKTKALAELEKAYTDATNNRADEKAANEIAMRDAKAAQTVVQQAMDIVADFYKKTETSLLQKGGKALPPPKFEINAAFDSKSGIMGMLEVAESDFARDYSETENRENEQEAAYEQFSRDYTTNKAATQKDLDFKEADKKKKESALALAKDDLKSNQKSLYQAEQYFDKLKPSCVKPDVSYEERAEMRDQEIQGLQEALSILTGDDYVQ